jgi:hypothetical protein
VSSIYGFIPKWLGRILVSRRLSSMNYAMDTWEWKKVITNSGAVYTPEYFITTTGLWAL